MIYGIGVDLVKISRVKKWLDSAGLLERYFHPAEKQFVLARLTQSRDSAAQSLAARFASKEALGKALGTGMSYTLRELEVHSDETGRPMFYTHGNLQKLFEEKKLRAHLSLSHEEDMAIAMVVLETVN